MKETKEMPAHVLWLRQRADRLARELQDDWNGTLRPDFKDTMADNMFDKLRSVGKQTLDVLYYGGDLGTEEEILADGDKRVEAACPQLVELLRFSENRLKAVLLETMEGSRPTGRKSPGSCCLPSPTELTQTEAISSSMGMCCRWMCLPFSSAMQVWAIRSCGKLIPT